MVSLSNATVYYPIDNDPDHGGGPIRRAGGIVERSGDGMPPHGWPQMVSRTPHAVVPDAEPGGAGYEWLTRMKFLPDGRLVPASALGAPLAPATVSQLVTGTGYSVLPFDTGVSKLLVWGTVAGTLLGSAIGAALAARRWRGLGVGAAIGLGSGVAVAGLLGRAAVVGAEYTRRPAP